MATNESWQLFVHNERHNHKVAIYNHGHAQATRLTEEQLHQIEHFRKSLFLFRSQLEIYDRNRMQGRNTVEEVLCLKTEESNVLSDIVIAHPTSIAMIRTWPVQHATIRSCRNDSDRKELHSGNSFYVQ
ncbi:hypothetical protein M9H77_09442 [Catharanthus roseus]|uniref:Uncharacterized protein n=1 Tax=Catharanthus roseus TaxID=4058 RepID=A0ACC0C0X8_CATRO|nr:hypothetical protein M9H77_09442 [Catharanthus roseus]